MSKDSTQSNNLQQDTENSLIQLFSFMEELGDKQKRIIWTFHDLYFKYDHLFISQEKLASIIPCCREHINRTIKLLCAHGYLTKKRRRRMTNIYNLNPILTDPLLKKKWKERHSQIEEVTSKVTSRNITEDYSHKALDGVKTPLPYIPQVYLRNTNASIKEVFEDLNIPMKDKIAFSRYSDEEIEIAFDQLANFIDQFGSPHNMVRFLQSKLALARKGDLKRACSEVPHHLKVLNYDDKNTASFIKYSESDFITGYEDFMRYKKRYNIENEPAMLHSLIKKRNGK